MCFIRSNKIIYRHSEQERFGVPVSIWQQKRAAASVSILNAAALSNQQIRSSPLSAPDNFPLSVRI
jgi:hypothetical protein